MLYIIYIYMYICMYGQHFQQSMDQPGMAANPARGCSFSRSPFAPENFVSRETGSAVPPRVSPLIIHTRAESDWLILIVLTHGFFFRFLRRRSMPSTAIGSVPSLLGQEQ